MQLSLCQGGATLGAWLPKFSIAALEATNRARPVWPRLFSPGSARRYKSRRVRAVSLTW